MVIGVGGVLSVGWLLWLFYDVGVWLVTWWFGYVYIRDRLLKTKTSVHLKYSI